MNPATDGPQFERRVAHDYFVRFHMAVILTAVTFSGVLASKGLLELGVHSPAVRFPVAVATSYAVFLGLVRIWIWYISLRQVRQATRTAQMNAFGAGYALGYTNSPRKRRGEGPDIDLDFEGAGESGGSVFSGFKGGSSGGGGASSSWDADAPVSAGVQPMIVPVPVDGGAAPAAAPSGGSLSGWFSNWSLGDSDSDGWIIAVLLIALALAIICAGGYLIYAAPQILPEAAWQAVLASALTRVAKGEHHNWMSGVLKSTWIPFTVVLLFASALGWSAHHYCPAAPRLVEVLRDCVLR